MRRSRGIDAAAARPRARHRAAPRGARARRGFGPRARRTDCARGADRGRRRRRGGLGAYWTPRLGLLGLAALCGTNFPLIHFLDAHFDDSAITAARFALATLPFAPRLASPRARDAPARASRRGCGARSARDAGARRRPDRGVARRVHLRALHVRRARVQRGDRAARRARARVGRGRARARGHRAPHRTRRRRDAAQRRRGRRGAPPPRTATRAAG